MQISLVNTLPINKSLISDLKRKGSSFVPKYSFFVIFSTKILNSYISPLNIVLETVILMDSFYYDHITNTIIW